MTPTNIRLLQGELAAAGFDPGPVDGKFGNATLGAVDRALADWTASLFTPADWPADYATFPDQRRTVLAFQACCRRAGLDAGALDGYWGPQTEYAAGQLAQLRSSGKAPTAWRDKTPADANPNGWPKEADATLRAFYGEPGTNLVSLELPYPLRLSWDTASVVRTTQCHAKVRDSLRHVLEQVLAHYGQDSIRSLRLDLFGGGFNMRQKRGGSSMSTHAWGIAFDFDPDRNKLEWGRDRAGFAKADYDAWWSCWEEQGWASLGRHKNYDWMHVQAACL
ncbi:MAG TPA: M15 family metallopeptidase [Rhodocyclaceae bacterium]|nr:M15 family metallopeptidase [Rhodocyclaceae bacterium]